MIKKGSSAHCQEMIRVNLRSVNKALNWRTCQPCHLSGYIYTTVSF